MREWLRLFFGGCAHDYPDYLDGVAVFGRFPNPVAVVPFKECLHCRNRKAK